jgi:hypothetical protein
LALFGDTRFFEFLTGRAWKIQKWAKSSCAHCSLFVRRKISRIETPCFDIRDPSADAADVEKPVRYCYWAFDAYRIQPLPIQVLRLSKHNIG